MKTGGGTAVVYEGLSTIDGSTVALKVLSVKDGKSVVPIKGVKREVRVLKCGYWLYQYELQYIPTADHK